VLKSSNLSDLFGEEKRDEDKYMLETIVIDSGIGISELKQKMLFKPFLELKNN